MKRTLLQKMGDFVLGKGFYIVLFLCVATIGISGYYLMNSLDAETQTPVTGTPEVVLPDPVISSPEVKAPQVPTQPVEEKKTQPVQPKENRTTAPKPAPVVSYVWPVEGEILRDFSVETLVYDQTMGDWRTHAGVDIAAEAGAKVQCVGDGVVKEVFTDDLMGATVVVDHQNGVISTYSNLAAEPVAAAGQEVESGTVLGEVGASAIAESALPSHLHLEMSRNGEPVDPVGIFSDET